MHGANMKMLKMFWLRNLTFKLHLGVGHWCGDDLYNVSVEIMVITRIWLHCVLWQAYYNKSLGTMAHNFMSVLVNIGWWEKLTMDY